MPSGSRILLAEDNDVNARLIVAVLERSGYEITVAVDGEQAARMGDSGDFDLILMDVNMPEVDGLEATRRIRAGQPPACNVTIVALTADDGGAMRKKCSEAGMDGYVTKPINMGELVKAVEENIGRMRKIA